uniref:C-X3-C motif chemokine ligand 1 n=1 Tax=Catagonus wagneri TaxID=51154 RepID=A0A8C3WTD5_9CETA
AKDCTLRQQFGVNKCSVRCSSMTSKAIPVHLLARYRRSQGSCGPSVIILTTKKQRLFCADPNETWVQEAMAYLDRHADPLGQNGGKFEKQIGTSEPRTTLATRGMDRSVVLETKVKGESSNQEAQKAFGTSPGLPTGAADSRATRSPFTSKAPDGGPETTELFNEAAITTSTSWQTSSYQPGAGLWAAKKDSEAPSTQVPSTQAPTLSYTVPEDNIGSEPVWIKGQDPTPENSLGRKEMGVTSAHTDAFMGPSSVSEVFVVSASSEESPSADPLASGRAPKAEEPIHATVDPQRLGILITPMPDPQAATRRQAVGLLAFLGLVLLIGVASFSYHSLQGCSHKTAEDIIEGLRYVPQSCSSNSYVLVPV